MFTKQRRIVINNRYTQTASMRNGGVMIRLTLKKLIIAVIVLLVLLVWAFFVGVLVGQGVSAGDANGAAGGGNSTAMGDYTPDEENYSPHDMTQPPRVAETPPPAQSNPPAQPQPNASRPAKPTPDADSATAAASDKNSDAVISPQELSAMSELKGKPTPPTQASINDDNARQAATASQGQPRSNAQTNSVATASAGRPEDPAPKATTSPGPGIFDYQYQVAATKDLDGAKRLVTQLRADGLRASMVQGNRDGSKLYRVHVDFRGTPSDTNQLREKLSKFGIDRVLLKTKVATQ